MRIIDAFLYDGEAWAVRARALELAPLDVTHVAVLANRTHQGAVVAPVALDLLALDAMRAGAHSTYVADLSAFDDRGPGGVGTSDYQVRERAHRDALADAAAPFARPGDVLLVSDVDEVPSASAVVAASERRLAVLVQSMYVWTLGWRFPGPWLGTTVAPWPLVLSPQHMRDARGTPACPEVPDGGWHLSWQGSPVARLRKLHGFSHAELAHHAADLEHLASDGTDINGVRLDRVNPEGLDWPGGLTGSQLSALIASGGLP